MEKQHPRSLLAYALVGVLCPLPMFAVCVVCAAAAGSWAWTEWIGWADVASPVIAWGTSAISGWISGRVLARRDGVAFVFSVVLANSAGWAIAVGVLVPAAVAIWANGGARPDELAIVSVMAFLVSAVGLPITWGTMRWARAKGVYLV